MSEPFPSFAAIERHIRALVARWPDRTPIQGGDKQFVCELFERHPDADGKRAGRQISHFEVRRNRFGTRSFFVIFEDGRADDFSWPKAIGRKAS